jgi:hypothetical protein
MKEKKKLAAAIRSNKQQTAKQKVVVKKSN